MDYSKMSDFDINCEVLAIFSPNIKHMCLSGDNSCFYDCGPTGDGWHQIDIPDYCNNPADAWPIIVEKKLSIYPSGERWGVEGFNADDPFYFDGNPLRAAMIVFLLMQEQTNVQDNPA